MQEMKVSVIMPVYNVEDYLEQCLDCVVNQTLQEIEIICVDDGSTDRSGEILEAYAAKDTRVKVFHQKNQYAGCARNLGLQHAAGKYVIFWDSDDLFDLQALEKLYRKAEEEQAEIVVCGANRMDSESGEIYPFGGYLKTKMLSEKSTFSKATMPQHIFNFTTNVPWNKMFLREFVQKHGLQFQPLRQANDMYFVMVAIFLSERITTVNERLITYRINNTASLTGKASANRFCVNEAFEAVWKKLDSYPEFDDAVRQSFANKALGSLVYSLRIQSNAAIYKELYDLYKSRLFETIGISGHEPDYFYDANLASSYEHMMMCDAENYMLFDFKRFEQNNMKLNAKLTSAKAKNKELKKDRDKEVKALNKEIQKLQKRVDELENSHAYRVGRSVTYVPGQIKKLLKKK